MRPNHHQFAALAYVVREGSFSAAARRLGVTQSTVTQHIAKLEAQIGNKLLVRSRDGVTVTRTGQEFLELADRFFEIDTAIKESLERYKSLNTGHLKVIANAPQPALKIIRQFGERLPDVHIDFSLCDWTTSLTMMRNGTADAGFITDPVHLNEFSHYPVEESRYVAYLRADDPLANRAHLTIEDLAANTVILPERGSLTERVVTSKLNEVGLSFPRVVRTSTFPVMCEAVLQGLGIALFLRNSSLLGDGIKEVPVAEFDKVHETCLVVTKDRAKLRLLDFFIEYVMETKDATQG